MSLADELQSAQRLFLDTAPIIYYVEGHDRYLPILEPVFARLDAGSLQGVTSTVTLSECLVVPFRAHDESLQQLFTRLIVEKSRFVTLDQAVAEAAARLRSQYRLNLLDAFQVAVALASRCDAFLTNDIALKRVEGLSVLVLEDFVSQETRG